MRILTALIVDEIRETDDGRVDLLGLREDLYFDALPVILERMTLFVELLVEPADRGRRHALEFRLSDAQGRILKAVPIQFSVPPDFPRASAPLDPTLFEIPFERPGPHALDILLGGIQERRIALGIYLNER